MNKKLFQKLNLNPIWLIILILKMLFWIIYASINLAISVLLPTQPTASIIKYKSNAPEKILHAACLLNVLIPGTIPIRTSNKSKSVYLHVLNCNTPEKAAKAQKDFSQLETILGKTFRCSSIRKQKK